MATDRPPPATTANTSSVETRWVWEDGEMVKKEITFVADIYRLFDAILLNAAANKSRDPKMDRVKVEIDVAENKISVWDNGYGIQKHFLPLESEIIFGHMLEIKCWTEFAIKTADGKRRKLYEKVFTNMGKKPESSMKRCKRSENWTMVSFKPDLANFGMDCLGDDDTVALMKRRVVDLGMCLGESVNVELDGTHVPCKTFEDYAKLYLKRSADKEGFFLYERVNPRWEVCVCVADGHFEQVSFVNNIATMKGGSHVDYITNQITTYLGKIVNLEPDDIKSCLWVFVNALIDNPAFDSVSKENLVTNKGRFGSTCKLTPRFLKEIAKSEEVVNRLFSYADLKQIKKLKEIYGKMKGELNIPKLIDADLAATADSGDCTLILTQDDFAKHFVMSGLSVVGQIKYGVFPLKGKLLNVKEASSQQLQKNAEIQNIKKILGLEDGKIYESVKDLRYGHLMIMADQDHDGSHFKGLLINFLHSFWPSLLRLPNFMLEFKTPIVKATKNKTKEVSFFYTMPDYEDWKKELQDKATEYSIKYYKGLGTFNIEEGAEYFADLKKHTREFVWLDDEDDIAFDLAFSRKMIRVRKNWLQAPEACTYIDYKETQIRYSDFIHKELRQCFVAYLQRSIPSMVDGLEPGQRKILFCAFKKPIIQEINVAQFSSYVVEHSAYHHGAESLISTIIRMAQNFVGSNNINLLQPNGQFGTRQMGGKDHAPANYIFTQLSPITPYLFHKADELVLQYLNDDGRSIEPAWFMPIIPMVLVNGTARIGIGGYASFIPNYNPRDIIANLKRLLNDEPMVPIHPWYKWFKGTIQKTASDDTKYTTKGIVKEIEAEGDISITELPVGRWTQDYKEFLDAASQDGKAKTPFIKAYMAYNDNTTVDFEVVMTENQMNTARQERFENKFKLTTTLSTSNMHLLDAKGVIKKYDTPEHILVDFFELRLAFYEKRKTALLHELEQAILLLKNKVKFIREVCEGKIDLVNSDYDELRAELMEKGFKPQEKASKTVPGTEYKYLLSMGIGLLTYENIEKLQHEMDIKKKDAEELEKTSPKSLWLGDLDALDKQLDGEYPSAERMAKINFQSPHAEEAPKKKAPAKRAAAGLPRVNKK